METNKIYFLACIGSIVIFTGYHHDVDRKVPTPNIIYILADNPDYGGLSIFDQEKITVPDPYVLVCIGKEFTEHVAGLPVCPERVDIDGDSYRIKWLYDESFDKGWVSRWIQEGDALVKVEDGELHQRKVDQEHPVQSTVWFRPELPQNLALRIRVRVDNPAENNAGNVNLVLHARENNGSPLAYDRSGRYSEYHEIPNYIITLVGGDMEQGHHRLRRNPGFNLLSDNQDIRSYVGETYELLVTVIGGRIRYYLDGEKTIDHRDRNPLPAGRMGLRTWNSNVVWEQIEIGRVEE